MKKIILSMSIALGSISFAQNTIPTTTVTGALSVNDSLHVTKNITTSGDITSKGELTSTDTLHAKENVIASKDIKVDGSIYVNQDVSIEGKLYAKGGLTFDGTYGLFRTAPTTTSSEIIQLGNSAAKPLPYLYYCETPYSQPWNQFYYSGSFVSYMPAGANASAPLVNAAVSLGIAPWNGNALIDVSGVDATGAGTNGLEINSFCKRNTYINAGWDLVNGINGGRVFMGAEVQMQRSLKIGYDGSNIIDANSAIEINQNTANAKGVKIKTYNNAIKAFTIEYLDGTSPFIVYGSGKTQIGLKTPIARATSSLTVDGEIACKSLYVLKPQSWADFVFQKKDIEKLESVEKYIKANNHLPGIPSEKEILENGYDINEMDAKLLEKIEILYLHIIALEKEIKELKSK